MKPQCETTPECLEQLARVMREFGFISMIDAISSEFIYYEGKQYNITDKSYIPHFDHPSAWSFAIAKLEDRPVFLGDTVFFGKRNGILISSTTYIESKEAIQILNIVEIGGREEVISLKLSECSLTPPKQTVSIKVGDNEPVEVEKAFASTCTEFNNSYITQYYHDTAEAAEQFRKAMKPLVKE